MKSSFDPVNQILEKRNEISFDEMAKQISELPIYQTKLSGCLATIIYTLSCSNEHALIAQFFDFICNNNVSSAGDFLIFWIRVSDSESVEIIVESVERNALLLSAVPNLSSVPFLRLIEKCENTVLPENIEFSGNLTSEEFTEAAPNLSRVKRVSILCGRVYIALSRIFQPFKFLAKKGVPAPSLDNSYVNLSKGIKLLSAQRIPSQNFGDELTEVYNFLNRQIPDTLHKTLYRTPPRPSACIDAIESNKVGFDICLILSIQGLIHSHEEDAKNSFKELVQKFANRCGLSGDEIIHIVTKVEKEKEETQLEFAKDLNESLAVDDDTTWDDIPFQPLLQPFDVPEDIKVPCEKPPIVTEESAMEEITQFAGTDKSQWFVGDELKEWRVSRLCIAHFVDQLDPDSFNFN